MALDARTARRRSGDAATQLTRTPGHGPVSSEVAGGVTAGLAGGVGLRDLRASAHGITRLAAALDVACARQAWAELRLGRVRQLGRVWRF